MNFKGRYYHICLWPETFSLSWTVNTFQLLLISSQTTIRATNRNVYPPTSRCDHRKWSLNKAFCVHTSQQKMNGHHYLGEILKQQTHWLQIIIRFEVFTALLTSRRVDWKSNRISKVAIYRYTVPGNFCSQTLMSAQWGRLCNGWGHNSVVWLCLLGPLAFVEPCVKYINRIQQRFSISDRDPNEGRGVCRSGARGFYGELDNYDQIKICI